MQRPRQASYISCLATCQSGEVSPYPLCTRTSCRFHPGSSQVCKPTVRSRAVGDIKSLGWAVVPELQGLSEALGGGGGGVGEGSVC